MYKPILQALHLFLFAVVLVTGASSFYFIKNGSSLTPLPTPTSTLKINDCGTPSSAGDTGWSLLRTGLERRVIRICDMQSQPVESVYIWRLDQKYFRLDVAYRESPKTLEIWQKETNALMVVNAGYYSVEDKRYFPDGLTIVNGKSSGRSFYGFGGMLAIDDSRAELRWLVEKPYNSSEPLQAALQSFPILVEPGGKLGFGPERENNVGARRTVIGQDQEGRILLIVTPQGYFTLHQLSVFLTESDLHLDIAVNLDGGGSTGIYVADPHEIIPSSRPLPFVILVYPR